MSTIWTPSSASDSFVATVAPPTLTLLMGPGVLGRCRHVVSNRGTSQGGKASSCFSVFGTKVVPRSFVASKTCFMKSYKNYPFILEDSLEDLGDRISLARRARRLTQQDLAAKAGIGLSTLLAVEKGTPSVQIGSVLMVLWALGLEGTFDSLSNLGSDKELSELMADFVPLRVRPRKPRSR
ncbi:helix-turn-helix domain-containing protein [Roseateles noduli]|uniref:helix-turn-helix domain-containing protein n=1 Tax=Roseateles noduli TaxID=2052484 RepID=UPI003D6621A0